MLWGYQECKSKSSAGRGCQVHEFEYKYDGIIIEELMKSPSRGKLSGRSASRLRKEILGTGDKEVAASCDAR